MRISDWSSDVCSSDLGGASHGIADGKRYRSESQGSPEHPRHHQVPRPRSLRRTSRAAQPLGSASRTRQIFRPRPRLSGLGQHRAQRPAYVGGGKAETRPIQTTTEERRGGRKRVGQGKGGEVRVDLGGSRINTKKKKE